MLTKSNKSEKWQKDCIVSEGNDLFGYTNPILTPHTVIRERNHLLLTHDRAPRLCCHWVHSGPEKTWSRAERPVYVYTWPLAALLGCGLVNTVVHWKSGTGSL